MTTRKRYSPEVKERAFRMLIKPQRECGSHWIALNSIAEKIGITAETLLEWLRQAEINQGIHRGLTTFLQIGLSSVKSGEKSSRFANSCQSSIQPFFRT